MSSEGWKEDHYLNSSLFWIDKGLLIQDNLNIEEEDIVVFLHRGRSLVDNYLPPCLHSQPSLSGLKKVCIRSFPSSSGILKGSVLILKKIICIIKKTKCVKRRQNASKIDKCIKRTNCTKKTKLIKTKCIIKKTKWVQRRLNVINEA